MTVMAVVPEILGGGIATARAMLRPFIQRLIPNRANVGGPDFVLSVVGYAPDSGFTPESVIHWNGRPLATSPGCPIGLIGVLSCVSATVPASEIATAGTASVFVQNPDAYTNFLPFTIGGEAPVDVPTLSEWSLVTLGVLLAAAALLLLGRGAPRP